MPPSKPTKDEAFQLTYPQHHSSRPTSERGNKPAEPVSNVCDIDVVPLSGEHPAKQRIFKREP